MDVSKRQLLQKALEKAKEHIRSLLSARRRARASCCAPISPVTKLMSKEQVADGQLLTLTYEQIASVDVE